jgi:hypothetical protein
MACTIPLSLAGELAGASAFCRTKRGWEPVSNRFVADPHAEDLEPPMETMGPGLMTRTKLEYLLETMKDYYARGPR